MKAYSAVTPPVASPVEGKSPGQSGQWLTSEELAALVVSYQRGRELENDLEECKERELWKALHKVVTEGRDAAQKLVESTMGLVWGRLWPEALGRLGEKQAKDRWGDLRSDASAYILSKAASYDPEINNSFNAYLSNGMDGFISDTVRGHGRGGGLNAASDRVLRMVGAALKEAEAEGRQISKSEIEAELAKRSRKWALERLGVQAEELNEEELLLACKRKLSKSGMSKALEDVDVMLQLARGDVSFDMKLSDDSGATVGDLVPAALGVEEQAFSDQQEARLDTLYKVALGDQAEDFSDMLVAYNGQLGSVEGAGIVGEADYDPARRPKAWTLNKLSERMEMSRVEVRNLLGERARARLSAPHAQFAALALEVDLCFKEEPTSTLDKVRSWPREVFAK